MPQDLVGLTALVAVPGAELFGSDRVAIDTVAALVAAGAAVTVTTPTEGPMLDRLPAAATVETLDVAVVRRAGLRPRVALTTLWHAARTTPAAWRLLRRVRPDVVFVNTVVLPWWIVLGRLAGARVVCHVHEAETSVPMLLRRVLFASLLAAHRVVLNSEYTGVVLLQAWPVLRGRTELVLNPVPGPPDPPRRAVRHDPPRIGFVGRVSARKGADVAVAAAEVLARRGTPVRLTVTGSAFPGTEDFVERLHADAAAGPAEVEFTGFAADVWPAFAAADVVIMPSTLDESFGNAGVEARLAARPIVVSDMLAVREAMAGAPAVRFVPARDADALADGITGVLADHDVLAAAALADAPVVRARHDPETYRRAIVAAVAAAR